MHERGRTRTQERMAIYQCDTDRRPDDEFEPGTLRHLASGVRGRLLDPRRTPVSVVEVRPATGFVLIRIEGFEDEGAMWEMPLEDAGHFQFELDGPRATGADVAAMETAIERFAHAETIEAGTADRNHTEARISECRTEADRWLEAHSRLLSSGRPLPHPADRRGDPDLAADLEAWLRTRDLWEIEEAFARVFVSNPNSGELVKGHRIVIAELGLADYRGGIVRDPATFEGAWTRVRRTEHVVSRLAFVRAMFARLGIDEVTVWRGAAIRQRLEARPGRTFVSTTFDEAVARSHHENGSADWTHVLVRQDVSVDRMFMTYHETAAMNTIFLEAEAVLLARRHDGWP